MTVLVVLGVLALLGLALSVRIVQQYERGVLFRLGRVTGTRDPGLTLDYWKAARPTDQRGRGGR